MFLEGVPLPLVVAAMLALGVLLLLSALRAGKPKAKPSPYVKQEALFSPAERSFLGVLAQAFPQHRVFGKIRLTDVVQVRSGLSASDRQAAFNRISQKHVAFVVCDTDSRNILCVVELDDKSHRVKSRQERDGFVEEALRAAGVPLLRFPAKASYALSDVREKLAGVLSGTPPEAEPPPEMPSGKVEPPQAKACPNCGSEMVVRASKRGRRSGAEFWACSAFPKCRTTLPLP